MNRNDAYQGEPGGPIAFMASNRVAANLLMLVILAAGLVALGALERQAWPTVPFNTIEVPLVHLRALGLTLDDVADAVRRSSLDLSAGSIDTRNAQVRVRTIGQRYDQLEFEEIVVIARNDDTVVRLGDIADVRDAFQNADLILQHQGRPALFVEVYRAEGEQVMDVARAVQEPGLSPFFPKFGLFHLFNRLTDLLSMA